MVDIFSIHVCIWNTETCQSHFKKGKGEETLEGMNQTGIHYTCIRKCAY
jgi:hypothetical protein